MNATMHPMRNRSVQEKTCLAVDCLSEQSNNTTEIIVGMKIIFPNQVTYNIDNDKIFHRHVSNNNQEYSATCLHTTDMFSYLSLMFIHPCYTFKYYTIILLFTINIT